MTDHESNAFWNELLAPPAERAITDEVSEPTELQQLMFRVAATRTRADRQLATRCWKFAEIRAEFLLENLDKPVTPENVRMVHRARQSSFVIRHVPFSNSNSVHMVNTKLGIMKSAWPETAERMQDRVYADANLAHTLDACLPLIADTPEDLELAKTVACITLQQIQYWQETCLVQNTIED